MKTLEDPGMETVSSLLRKIRVPREKHQNGWVVESGKRVKKWIGHWNPYRPDGTRTHATVVLGLKSKMHKWQAEDALRKQIEKETHQLAKHPEGVPTFRSFWENSYLPSRTWGAAMKSAVTCVISKHVLPKFGPMKLSELDKLMLQQHLNAMAESYSRSMVKKVLMQYRGLLEEAVEQELIPKNPARKLVMPPTRKPCGRFLTMEEYAALMGQLEFRDRLIVRMFCSMGFRPGELFALRWNDIEDHRIRVDESWSPWGMKEPKTEGSDAYLPMAAGVRAEMETWRGMCLGASPAELVFPSRKGGPISGHNYQRDVLVPAAERAGIMAAPAKNRRKGDTKRDKNTAVNFQAFRRTFGTWMQRTGASVKDAQGALRHSSPDQTLKVYMREIPAGVRTAMEELDRMFSRERGVAKAERAGS